MMRTFPLEMIYLEPEDFIEERDYKRLTTRLLELSVADNYEEAKTEWRMTGRRWRVGFGEEAIFLPPPHNTSHPNSCLCGHDIVWHFEIENTLNGKVDILGSTCIENWMVLRHLVENKGIKREFITEEMIQEWIKEEIKSMKAEWWWSLMGEQFQEDFDRVRELDLRLNVRVYGSKYDRQTRRQEPLTRLRKRREGKGMASVVWRWNHPDNPKNQQTTRGYPNESLCRDVTALNARFAHYQEILDNQDADREARIQQLATQDAQTAEREVLIKKRDIAQVMHSQDEEAHPNFLQMCEFYNIKPFSETDGQNDWECNFLKSIRTIFINNRELSKGQALQLKKILFRDKKGGLSWKDEPATTKQLSYITALGGTPTPHMTKGEASDKITALKKR